MKINADYFITKFNLQKHPEGGYFSENYRSSEIIKNEHLPKRYNSDRCFSTCIYFLLESDDFSSFHRIKSDEIWHFYAGSPLTVYKIDEKGDMQQLLLGNDPTNGESFYALIKKGQWFAAKTNHPDSFTLVGCTVAPGFEFDDFELANRRELINQFPQHKNLITRLTRAS